jgi:hypothetical protein
LRVASAVSQARAEGKDARADRRFPEERSTIFLHFGKLSPSVDIDAPWSARGQLECPGFDRGDLRLAGSGQSSHTANSHRGDDSWRGTFLLLLRGPRSLL